ncbi:MAG TPA: class I SAM-dependent methyltransferase [Aggregatilinea sp.]|uniref:class I SAM-dependent methyltransferase n=1 Tax=Aggregatilinea sp. TaxID=2806333 RepID=UPI002BC13AEE|nr:class I SAM-dependent methyltransferase [Aggregatilinea sp.]HML24873.1 class I SAM-dependent methyltransferase [Aggregatilinea sp.]
MSTTPNSDIDAQIRAEIERLSREAVDWEQSESGEAQIVWKPRAATDRFVEADGGKRLLPIDMQVYYDLQLSRGASRPASPDSDEWIFDSPEVGTTTHAEMNAGRLDHFTRFVPLTPESRILDIGSRNGQLIYFLNDRGYRRVSGMDVVKLNVLWCQKNGFDVKLGDAHTLSKTYTAGSFDAIFAYHVLEHTYDPAQVLREFYTILGERGAIHIEIPLEAISLRFGHVYNFAPGELARLAREAGFIVLDVRQGEGNERLVARKKAGPLDGLGWDVRHTLGKVRRRLGL